MWYRIRAGIVGFVMVASACLLIAGAVYYSRWKNIQDFSFQTICVQTSKSNLMIMIPDYIELDTNSADNYNATYELLPYGATADCFADPCFAFVNFKSSGRLYECTQWSYYGGTSRRYTFAPAVLDYKNMQTYMIIMVVGVAMFFCTLPLWAALELCIMNACESIQIIGRKKKVNSVEMGFMYDPRHSSNEEYTHYWKAFGK